MAPSPSFRSPDRLISAMSGQAMAGAGPRQVAGPQNTGGKQVRAGERPLTLALSPLKRGEGELAGRQRPDHFFSPRGEARRGGIAAPRWRRARLRRLPLSHPLPEGRGEVERLLLVFLLLLFL